MSRNSAILLAAGKGSRYNGKKQDILFHDKPLVTKEQNCQLMEAPCGSTSFIKPHLIETGMNLFKVTYPGELEILEFIYRMEQGNAQD